MLDRFRHYVVRHEPSTADLLLSLKAGLGALLGIGATGAIAATTGIPLLLAPFGASAVLLFAQPKSPLAQPANVVGGYFLALAASMLVTLALPAVWWAAAIGVGITVAAMTLLRLTHPPAGAIPIVAVTASMPKPMLLEVVTLGSLLLVAIAVLFHRLPPRHVYPKPAA